MLAVKPTGEMMKNGYSTSYDSGRGTEEGEQEAKGRIG